LDLLTVGPKFMRFERRATAAAVDRYLCCPAAAADLSSKPAAQAAVDLWDRQTRAEGRMDGRTLDSFMTLIAYTMRTA